MGAKHEKILSFPADIETFMLFVKNRSLLNCLSYIRKVFPLAMVLAHTEFKETRKQAKKEAVKHMKMTHENLFPDML